MRKNIILFLLINFVFLLSGCDAYRNRPYSYTPPAGDTGKHCTKRCYIGKNSCQQLCMMKNPGCAAKAERTAKSNYEAYKDERIQAGKPIRKHLKDFVDMSSCKQACNCTNAFNTCYSACGGEVIPLW